MASNPSVVEQLILAKLDAIMAKLDEMKVNAGLAATSGVDALKKVIQDEVSATASAAKEKKKTAATETKAEDGKAGSAKLTHPSLPEVTEAAWALKKTGDDFEKRIDWFVSVLSKHPTHLHTIIGTDEVTRITNTTDYATFLADCKKQGDREKAKTFLKALKHVRGREGTFADISKKLVADYDAQLAVRNSKAIGQLTQEVASAAESAAAAALSGLTAPPSASQPAVTIHAQPSATPAPVTTTESPAAQLAAA